MYLQVRGTEGGQARHQLCCVCAGVSVSRAHRGCAEALPNHLAMGELECIFFSTPAAGHSAFSSPTNADLLISLAQGQLLAAVRYAAYFHLLQL